MPLDFQLFEAARECAQNECEAIEQELAELLSQDRASSEHERAEQKHRCTELMTRKSEVMLRL